MSNFAKLKKSQQDSLKEMTEKVNKEKTGGTKSYTDARYWKPTEDEHGNGSAIIRYLGPAAVDIEKDESAPAYVQYHGYNFKNIVGEQKRYYIERNRASITDASGKPLPDPVMEYNSVLWERGAYNDKSPEREQARRQKRAKHYIANILVIKDTNAPENDGKAFLFDYGPAMNGFIEEAIAPAIDDLTGQPMRAAFDPFNYWTGANFYMRFFKQESNKQRTYKNSTWGEPCPVYKSDKEIEALHLAQHSLLDEIAPDKYKSYDELKKRLNYVLGIDKPAEPDVGNEKPKATQAKAHREVKAPEPFEDDQIQDNSLPWNDDTSDGAFSEDDIAKLLADD